MRSTIVRHELAVGAFVVLGALAVAGSAALKTRERGLIGAKEFSFVVDEGSGLVRGAPVLMNGVQVGEVADIELTPDHRVLVRAQVAPKFAGHLRQDARATVVEPPLLGSTKVELSPGRSDDLAPSGQELQGGLEGSILEQLGELQGKVDGVIARVDRFVANADETLASVKRVVDRVDRGEGLVGQLVNDPALAEDARATLKSVRSVVEAADRGEGVLGLAVRDGDLAKDLKAAVADVRSIAAELERGEGSLGRLLKDPALVDEATGLVRDARGAIGKLDELNVQARQSAAKVEAVLETVDGAVKKIDGLAGDAGRVTNELADTLHRINQGDGTIAALLNDPALYRETKSLLKELRETVEDLREQAPINSFLGVVFAAF